MALYENIFIVRQDVSSTQVDAITDSFEEIVTGLGGSVAKREYWGLRTLAYRIKKNKKGHYVLFNIDAPHDAINELGRQMRLHEDVLRELTIRLDSFPETPSPIMLTKGDRDRDRASREAATPAAAPDEAGAKTDAPKAAPEAVSEAVADIKEVEPDAKEAVADVKEAEAIAPAEEKEVAAVSPKAKPKRAAAKKPAKVAEAEESAEEENS
jgi:small subunit ribosomal protein S6